MATLRILGYADPLPLMDPGCLMSMEDFARFCCPNSQCSAFRQRNAGNLSVHDRFGKQCQYRLFVCHACQHTFSEHKGTVFFRAKLPHDTIVGSNYNRTALTLKQTGQTKS